MQLLMSDGTLGQGGGTYKAPANSCSLTKEPLMGTYVADE